MKILEYKCKQCGYVFTRILEDNKKKAAKKEDCSNCGGEASVKRKLGIEKDSSGCGECGGCNGCG